jgi:hypothetical protein
MGIFWYENIPSGKPGKYFESYKRTKIQKSYLDLLFRNRRCWCCGNNGLLQEKMYHFKGQWLILIRWSYQCIYIGTNFFSKLNIEWTLRDINKVDNIQ